MSTTNKILICIIAAMAIIIGFMKCSGNNTVLNNVVNAKDTAYTEKINGILAEYNKAVVLETQAQMKIVLASNDTLRKIISRFKQVTNTVTLRTDTRIEKDTIPFLDTIPCSFASKTISQKSSTFSLFGKVNQKGLIIDSMQIPNKQSIVLGEVKKNIWGKTEQGIYVVNSNPLVKTQAIQNLTIVHKRKLIERPLFWFASGLVGGAAIILTKK